MLKIIKYSRIIFFILVGVYAIVAIVYLLGKPDGIGDEAVFLRDLNIIKSKGWLEAIKMQISIPFMIPAYLLSFIFKDYIALRLANVLITVFLFSHLKKRRQGALTLYAYLIFFFCTTLFFFMGSNDALFTSALVIFLNEIYLLQNTKKWNSTIAFIALIIAFFTRELIIVYLPIVLYGLFIVYKNRKEVKINLAIPITVLLLFLVINIPSINQNGKLSYDRKPSPDKVIATWPQLQYLAQLKVNNGEIKNFSHPSWKQVDDYLKENGMDSLPKGTLDGVFFDIELTVKEFFKDLYYSLFFGFRQLGLMLLIPLLIAGSVFFKDKKVGGGLFIPISLVIMLCAFSLIIISFIEPRWLAAIFIMTIVYYFDLEMKFKIPDKLILANYIILILFTCYGGFRLFGKLL